jgi:hypothetical protein
MASQKERILADLEIAARLRIGRNFHNPGAVCGSEWLGRRLPRYAARINELRNEGHTIVTGRCKQHKTATYRLADND